MINYEFDLSIIGINYEFDLSIIGINYEFELLLKAEEFYNFGYEKLLRLF